MQEKMRAILSAFDIRKLKSRCNFPGCERRPDVEISISQRSHRKGGRSLASIYVCKHHLKDVESLVGELRASSPGLMTEFSSNDIRKGR